MYAMSGATVINTQVQTCSAVASVEAVADDAMSFTCEPFGGSEGQRARVHVTMVACWPEDDDKFQVVAEDVAAFDGMVGVSSWETRR